jgi:major membrane immunogen (membrane-anchored lipoprotein)
MKILILILIIITASIFSSCSKTNNKKMTVIKDCTGTYLEYNDKDYHVCNNEITDSFENGTKVRASFTNIANCLEIDETLCEMLHKNEGWIKVTEIN